VGHQPLQCCTVVSICPKPHPHDAAYVLQKGSNNLTYRLISDARRIRPDCELEVGLWAVKKRLLYENDRYAVYVCEDAKDVLQYAGEIY
jgi:hypothetical protein